MLLTLGAAGATLLAMFVVIGIPAVDACRGDERGLAQCLRGLVDDKFDLGLDTPPALPPQLDPVTETPQPADAMPDLHVAEALAPRPASDAERLLVPDEPPAAPPPEFQDEPEVTSPGAAVAVTTPDPQPPLVPSLPQAEESDAVSPELMIAVIQQPNPAPRPVPIGLPPDIPASAADLDPAQPDLPLAPADAVEAEVVKTGPPSVPPWTADPPPVDLPVPAETAKAVLPASSFDPPPSVSDTVVVPANDAPDLTAGMVADAPAPIDDPPPVSAVPVPPLLPPAPDWIVAAIDPSTQPEKPSPPTVPVLQPSIDAVEIDGDDNFIAGNGPSGAVMRLYVDGIPVGVSPVEGGRWLVEGVDLLTEEQQTLKVEALDPLSGKSLGEASVVFEGPIPATEAGDDEAAALPTEPNDRTTAGPDEPLDISGAPEPLAVAADPAEPEEPTFVPSPIPSIAPVVPEGETASVTILGPAGDDSGTISTLPTGDPSPEAIVTLGARPAKPAIVAHFTSPTPQVADDVTVLHAIPFGDPGAGRFVSGKAIIRRGDTLWGIAHRYYGRGIHYRTILRANRDLIARPGRIYPGQVFDLPLVYDD